jgi:photosystem II stability/assembly factor-like uncharacterized protein
MCRTVLGQLIFHTQDGGATWATQYEKAPPLDDLYNWIELNSVFFTDSQNGWAVGNSVTIYGAGWGTS